MIRFVLWKWGSVGWKRTNYTAEHVNVAARMIRRHCHVPHDIVCLTDEPSCIDECRTEPLWHDLAEYSGCFRRLKIVEVAQDLFDYGDTVISCDIDCIVLNNITHLTQFDEPFAIWHRGGKTFGGALYGFKVGNCHDLWRYFDPANIWYHCKLNRHFKVHGRAVYWPAYRDGYTKGSEQAYIGWWLDRHGVDYHKWGKRDGIYNAGSWLEHDSRKIKLTGALPDNARIVFFNGRKNPWDYLPQYRWVEDNWR